MECEFIPTTRKEDSALFKNHLYYKKRTNEDGSLYWRCQKKGCSASITTEEKKVVRICGKKIREDGENLVGHSNNHELSVAELEVLRSKQAMFQGVQTSSEPVEKIYLNEQNKLAAKLGDMSLVATELQPFYSIKATLYRRRNEQYPPLPPTLDELNIDGYGLIMQVSESVCGNYWNCKQI